MQQAPLMSSRKEFLATVAGLGVAVAATSAFGTTPAAALDLRLKQLADYEAIRTLTARYATLIARGEAAKASALFTDDGRFVSRQDVRGRAALEAMYAAIKPGNAFPLITNHLITLNGTTATGTCTFYSPFTHQSGPSLCGAYADKYAFVEDKWLFSERVFHRHDGPPP